MISKNYKITSFNGSHNYGITSEFVVKQILMVFIIC